MTEIREEIARHIYDAVFPGADWNEPSEYEKEPFYDRADNILSIKELAIVDREAELPKCDVEYNPLACGPEDDTDNCYRSGWDEAQQVMLKAGWRKEVK